MERVILHSDLNNFYASVECARRPELRGLPVAVGGDENKRHGIVLAKNQLAKQAGVKTAEALWQARQKCPGLVVIPPDFPAYMEISRKVRKIYLDYTDQVEPFGIDEAWLDVTGSTRLYGNGESIAHRIRRRVREELGVTVSVGVSFNKIFAKLGSDMKKPDAVTVIGRENYRQTVWKLPVNELLYVGPATQNKLQKIGVFTIGDLAAASPQLLTARLGKLGEMLHTYACGEDTSPVLVYGERDPVKSVGNSTTTPRDLTNEADVKLVFYILAESVAMRLRRLGMAGQTVSMEVRDVDLNTFSRQMKLSRPTNLADELAEAAMRLFRSNYRWNRPIRSVGLSASDLTADWQGEQMDFFTDESHRVRQEKLSCVMDELRERYGYFSVQRALLMQDRQLNQLNPREEPSVLPAPQSANMG